MSRRLVQTYSRNKSSIRKRDESSGIQATAVHRGGRGGDDNLPRAGKCKFLIRDLYVRSEIDRAKHFTFAITFFLCVVLKGISITANLRSL